MQLPGFSFNPFRSRGADVRPSAIAGTWYSADRAALEEEIADLLNAVGPQPPIERLPAAFIAPHAGYQWSGRCAAHLYRSLRDGAGKAVRRVILLAPSHHAAIGGASLLPVRGFETPLGEVPVDQEAVGALLGRPPFHTVAEAHAHEHADEIQLPFLQSVLTGPWRLLDVVIQGTGLEEWEGMACALLPFVDEETLVIASSDFTHYGRRFGFLPFTEDVPDRLRQLDLGAVDASLTGDPAAWSLYRERTGITVCGFEPIGILLSLLQRIRGLPGIPDMTGRLLDYYRSGDLNGDFTSCVSYASVLFQPAGAVEEAGDLTGEDGALLLGLARRTLVSYLRTGRLPDVPERLETRRGVFVTLRRGGRLRGCIGSLAAEETLPQAVIRHAVQAAIQDPRFPPLSAEEIEDTRIEISVLTEPRMIGGVGEIRLGRDGIVLEAGAHKAVFLPQVAQEQGWDLPTTLNHLAMKAGLAPGAWRDPGTAFRTFRAQVFEEPEEISSGRDRPD